MEKYDIVIIGSGIAGNLTASLLNSSYKTACISKKPKQGKCCGGLVCHSAQNMLTKLGLYIPRSVLVAPQLFSVRAYDADYRINRHYFRHYLNIDRPALDRWLRLKIPAHVNQIDGLVTGIKKAGKGKGHVVAYMEGGRRKSIYTRILIGADGANSIVRKHLLGDKDTIKRYTAIQEYFAMDTTMRYYQSIFSKRLSSFYCWTIQKENQLVVGGAFDDHPSARFEKLKHILTQEYGLNLSNPVKREGAFILRPRSLRDICTGGNNIYLVGEAAGFISPSSAEGISYGLRSACALAKALNGPSVFSKINYRIRTISIKISIFIKTFKSFAIYTPLTRFIIMKLKIGAFTPVQKSGKNS